MTRKAIDEAVAKLDALDDGDPEVAHGEADEILVQFARPELRDAWRRAAERVGFWYA